MRSGFRGAYVIAWSQTELDGLSEAPRAALVRGAAWSWNGDVLRVDGPSDILQLDDAIGKVERRVRAARAVHKLVGVALGAQELGAAAAESGDKVAERGFVVTDGARQFVVSVIESVGGGWPLLLFVDDIPPRDVDLWIVDVDVPSIETQQLDRLDEGIICFTPGTRIETPLGLRLIEDLRPGDRVQTRDNGVQEILWSGSRRMTGARLFAMPHMRPIRISAGALGLERPDQEMLVSPDHQMLLQGERPLELFNEREVLVAARHLVNGETIRVDLQVREVTYVHLLFEAHQIITANGVASESFHPASANLEQLDAEDRQGLLDLLPDLAGDRMSYGAYARRSLRGSEAAILAHAA